MRKSSVEKALHDALIPVCAAMGFRPSERLDFVRGDRHRLEMIRFPTRSARGLVYLTFNVGVHFESLQQVLDPTDDEPTPYIMMPIHLLHEDRDYFEWSITDGCITNELLEQLREEILSYALPYCARFDSLEAVRTTLESEGWLKSTVIGPDQRILILAAIAWINGQADAARQMLQEALEARKGHWPKVYPELEALLARIGG